MEWLVIYLLVMCESIASVFTHFFILTMVCAFVYIGAAVHADTNYNDWKDYLPLRKKLVRFAILGIVLTSIGNIIPSQKDMAIIVASGATYNAITSETGQRIGGKAVSLLEKKIDEILEEKEIKETK